MNKFKNISCAMAVVAAASIATSCNKLDEYNPNGTTDQAIWTTPTGFMTVVNSSYYYIHNWYGIEDGLFLQETGTDLWVNPVLQPTYANQITEYESFLPTYGTNKNAWTYSWTGINLCNSGIAYIDKAGFTDPAERNRRLGELRFLRALYYFHVVENWGGVMLRTTPTDGAALTATRNTPEEIYDLMISDLLYAKDNLPVSWGAEYMRASKKSAMGLLARVYLTRAYYSTGGDAQAWFTKARDAALDVINNKSSLICDLWATPGDLWNPNNNKNNKEALFVVSWSPGTPFYNYNGGNNKAEGNRLYKWFQTKYIGRPGLVADLNYGYDNDQRLMPTWHLLDLFDDANDARYAATFQELWKANTAYTWTKTDTTTYHKTFTSLPSLAVGDSAMLITKGVWANKAQKKYLAYDATTTYVNPVPGQGAKISQDPLNGQFWVNFKKFADATRTSPTGTGGFNDVFVIRLAEMYMIAAEADFQLGDNVNAAANINVLRQRAAKPTATNFLINPSDVTLKFILDERAREFCGELQRWYDLKRVFRGDDFPAYIKTWNPDIKSVQTYHRLRPIPQTEIDALLNGAEFGQNAGY